MLPAKEAEAATFALAAEIAANAPLAVQGMKRVLQLLEASAERGLTAAERGEEVLAQRTGLTTEDLARRAARLMLATYGP